MQESKKSIEMPSDTPPQVIELVEAYDLGVIHLLSDDWRGYRVYSATNPDRDGKIALVGMHIAMFDGNRAWWASLDEEWDFLGDYNN